MHVTSLLRLVSVFASSALFATPLFAAPILLSENRGVVAGGTSDPGSPPTMDTSSSAGNFAPYSGFVSFAAPGVFADAGQTSTITTTEISLETSLFVSVASGFFSGFTTDYARGISGSDFDVRFQLPHATEISISASNLFFSGDLSLASSSVTAPLIWGTDAADIFANNLTFDAVLPAGIYTLSSHRRYDFVAIGDLQDERLDGLTMTLRFGAEAAPDEGPLLPALVVAVVATLALGSVITARRRSASLRSRS